MDPKSPERQKINDFLKPPPKRSLIGRLFRPIYLRIADIKNRFIQPEFRRMAFFTAFLVFSCWMSWRMQEKAEQLKTRMVHSNSLKQEMIHKENQYLDKMLLRKTEVANRKVEDVPDAQKKYRFQDYDDDELTTRSDLVQRMYDDYMKGIEPPPDYRREVLQHADRVEQIRRGI